MRSRTLTALRVVPVLLLLGACAWGPGTRIKEPVLLGQDLIGLLHGNTYAATTESGSRLDIYYRSDGLAFMRGRRKDGVPFEDRGLWSIEDDRICTRWERVRGHRKTCEWASYRAGTMQTYDPIGRPTASGRVYEGNASGLGELPATPPAAPKLGAS